MTTATKKPSTAEPSSDIFAAPASLLPQPAVDPDPPVPCLEKRETLEAMADDLDQRRIQMLTAGSPPDAGLFDDAEDFLVALADDDLVWCKADWPLLVLVAKMAQYTHRLIAEGEWRTSSRTDTVFWALLGDVLEGCKSLCNPPPIPQPRQVRLESLAELDALKPPCTDEQIARIFDWTDADGRPDVWRVREARENPESQPTPKFAELPPEGGFPTRSPSLHLLKHVADRLQASRDGR